MSLSLSVPKAVICLSLAVVLPSLSHAAARYATHGSEYSAVGPLLGDQVRPSLAIQPSGGFLVWCDNRTDGDGLGVSALQLDAGLSGVLSSFRVNETASGDQERPQVGLLRDGGAVFVWQGGVYGAQKVFARFLSPANAWTTPEIQLSPEAGDNHVDAAVAVLGSGNVVVVWSSYNVVGPKSMRDVYGQILTSTGEKVGAPFQVNTFANFNQRNPAVTALPNGGFAVCWISEQQRVLDNSSPIPSAVVEGNNPPSVDVYARVYSSAGVATTSELLVNTDNAACSNPSITALEGGQMLVAWSQNDPLVRNNGWDIYARLLSLNGPGNPAMRVNSHTLGDQLAPQVSGVGQDCLVVWTSLGQDGSREGVYGQFFRADGVYDGMEFRANTTTVSKQMHPAVAADGVGRFLVAWTSYVGGEASFDLFAQRYSNTQLPLWQMDAPFVSVPFSLVNQAYSPEIQVSWPEQSGVPVQGYKVYVDGAEAVTVTENSWVMTAEHGLKANETRTFQVAFVTEDGRQSPISSSATARTWGGFHWNGIPGEWMSAYYGTDFSTWPAATRELANGGPTLLEVFLSGGSPLNSGSWLRATLAPTEQGVYLEWNPQPGLMYQVQSSADLQQWTNVGSKRFASGSKDSVFLGYGTTAYYRVVLMR